MNTINIKNSLEELQYLIPWEKKDNYFISFFETFIDSITRPNRFFSNIRQRESGDLPLAYGIISTLIGTLFASLLQIINTLQFIDPDLSEIDFFISKLKIAFLIPQSIFIIPVICLILIYVLSLIYHILIYFISAKNMSFSLTRNVLCYAIGSSFMLNFIPFIGALLCVLSCIVLIIIGLSKGHSISKLSALIILFAPIVFIIIFATIISSAFYLIHEI